MSDDLFAIIWITVAVCVTTFCAVAEHRKRVEKAYDDGFDDGRDSAILPREDERKAVASAMAQRKVVR